MDKAYKELREIVRYEIKEEVELIP